MRITKIIVVFVTLIDRLCMSKIVIETSKSEKLSELEDAAIHLLTTCYGKQGATILLFGEFPGRFIAKLSSHQSFATVLLDERRRAEDYRVPETWQELNRNRLHRARVVVTMAMVYKRIPSLLNRLMSSVYDDPRAFVLVLGESRFTDCIGCNARHERAIILWQLNKCGIADVIWMFHDRQKRIIMYTSNPFGNRAPRPWQEIGLLGVKWPGYPKFSLFTREYQKNNETCENLVFDKDNDVNGLKIPVIHTLIWPGAARYGPQFIQPKPSYQADLIDKENTGSLIMFLKHINGTPIVRYFGVYSYDDSLHPVLERNIVAGHVLIRTKKMDLIHIPYPDKWSCFFLVTQFRGYKSQLQKLYGVIDERSWIGILIVYLITIVFLKYFFHLPVMVGFLNLVRLTCNCGLPMIPSNVASRVYVGCLLFFIVTIQGVFMGNWAALLTHDFPNRQVNTIQDLADLGYSIILKEEYAVYFDDPAFKGRIHFTKDIDDTGFLKKSPLHASVGGERVAKLRFLANGFYTGPGCFGSEPVTFTVPLRWIFIKRFDRFIGIMTSAGTTGPFDGMVYVKRQAEIEAQEIYLEPKVITLTDMGFAFVILAVGLSFAFIAFVGELLFDLYHQRITMTRVIAL